MKHFETKWDFLMGVFLPKMPIANKKNKHMNVNQQKKRVFQQISTDRWFKQYAKETWDGDYDYDQSNKRKTRDPHKQGLKDLKGFETSANETCHLGYASKMG